MKFQKGQSVVEFALVLPIFFVLFFGIFYFGMIFADYMTLSNVARSSAREAAMITSSADAANSYQSVRMKYDHVELPLDAFTWNVSTDYFKITYDSADQNVQVNINAPLNTEGASIAHTFYKLIGNTGKDFSLNITYTMYSEYKPTK